MARFSFLTSVMALLFACCLLRSQEKDKPSGLDGIWEGPLRVGGVELFLAFRVTKEKEGQWVATMSSLDQGSMEILCDTVEVDGKKITISLPKLKASYKGVLSGVGQELKGTFEQRGMKFPLELKRVDKMSTRKRPQTPKPPFAYKMDYVEIENPEAKIKLAGTLSIPEGKGPFPAVVLVSGSGPQDRDETIFRHKPFLVLADHLTRNGIAVLRYDDRGVGKSKGDHAKATTADFATDAFAAVQFLAGNKDIDPRRIGMVGHSEGGLIAPMVAAQHPDKVAFIILLAGPGARGDLVIQKQVEAIGRAAGASPAQLQVSSKLQKHLMDLAMAQPDPVAAKKALKGTIQAFLAKLTPEERKALGEELEDKDIQNQTEEGAAVFASPWMRYFLRLDPADSLRKVKCPVLALNGSLDLQVLAEQNVPLIEKALQAGGNDKVTTKVLPGLNHLFQTAKNGSVSEYSQIEETLSPQLLDTVTDWIWKQK